MADTPLVDYQITDTPTDSPFTSPPNSKTKAKPNPNRKAPGPLPPWREGAIAKWCTDVYVLIGNGIKTFDEVCGEAVISIAVPVGLTYEKMAKQNNSWRRFFGWAMQSSTAAELFMAHAPLAAIVLTHHGPFRKATENMADKFAQEFSIVVDELKKNTEAV